MYIFFFIYLFIIKKIIQLLDGKYVNSLSSYTLLLNLFSPCDNYLDFLFLFLAFVSSIHHSIRHKEDTKLNSMIHALDSGLIVSILSYIFFHNFNFFPISLSLILSFIVIYTEFKYKYRTLKKVITCATCIMCIYESTITIIPILFALYFFSKSKLWSNNNFLRFGWHSAATFSILSYLINHFDQ
tara:strand:- start:491 stop:1045 length:555 start_codon:yes stop_codon:yes gene_type:complete